MMTQHSLSPRSFQRHSYSVSMPPAAVPQVSRPGHGLAGPLPSTVLPGMSLGPSPFAVPATLPPSEREQPPAQLDAAPQQPQTPQTGSLPRPMAQPFTMEAPAKYEAPVKGLFHGRDFRRIVASGFTMAIFVAFSAPAIVCWHLGNDPDVQYWIGRHGELVVLVPLFLIAVYVAHLNLLRKAERPSKRIFLIPILVLGVFFAYLGGTFLIRSLTLSSALQANDCGGQLPEKHELQKAYSLAHLAWNTCVERMAQENGGAPLTFSPVLQSCPEWELMTAPAAGNSTDLRGAASKADAEKVPWEAYPLKGSRRTGVEAPADPLAPNPATVERWQYLASVEVNYACGGFCDKSQPLWTHFDQVGRLGGQCANFVGHKFLVVQHHGYVILGTNLAAVLLTGYLLHASRTELDALGYDN